MFQALIYASVRWRDGIIDAKTRLQPAQQKTKYLWRRGAQVVVLGCTEIPLAFDPATVDVPVVNASRVLAEAALRLYQEQVRERASDSRWS